MHGGQKLFVMGPSAVAGFLGSIGVPFPEVNAGLAIAAEFGGGLALLAGAFSRLAGLATAFTMVVATVTVHLANGFFLPNGYEFTVTLLLASLAIVAAGPGAFSVDAWIVQPLVTFHRAGRRTELPPSGLKQWGNGAMGQ